MASKASDNDGKLSLELSGGEQEENVSELGEDESTSELGEDLERQGELLAELDTSEEAQKEHVLEENEETTCIVIAAGTLQNHPRVLDLIIKKFKKIKLFVKVSEKN